MCVCPLLNISPLERFFRLAIGILLLLFHTPIGADEKDEKGNREIRYDTRFKRRIETIYMSVKSNYTRNIQIMLTEVFYMQVTIHTVVTNRRICQIR